MLSKISTFTLLFLCTLNCFDLHGMELQYTANGQATLTPLEAITGGDKHFAERDFPRALFYYEIAEKRSVNLSAKAHTLVRLGILYENGFGVAKDRVKACSYYVQAAEQNDNLPAAAEALARLAEIYYTQADFAKAQVYYELVEKQDYLRWAKAVAWVRLGRIYLHSKNTNQAIAYFELAAEQNDRPWAKAEAWTNLAEIYLWGFGVEKNPISARHYYELAAKQNDNPEAKALSQARLAHLGQAKEAVPTRDKNGNEPLLTAILATRSNPAALNMVLSLVGKGADVNSKGAGGNTPLICATFIGDEQLVAYLIGKTAAVNTPNDNGETPLMIASACGHTRIVVLLFSAGAAAHLTDRQGNTALSVTNNPEIVRLLGGQIDVGNINIASALAYSRNPQMHTNATTQAELDHNLALTAGAGTAEEVRQLNASYKKAPAHNVKTVDFFHAITNGNVGTVEAFLESGGSANTTDTSDCPALIRAANANNEKILQILLDKGADINKRNPSNGHTALFYVVVKGNTNAVRLLVNHGADVNIKSHSGDTVFDFVRSDSEIWQILKKKSHKSHGKTSEDPETTPCEIYSPSRPARVSSSPASQSDSSPSGINAAKAAQAIIRNLSTFASLALGMGHLGSDLAHHHMGQIPGDFSNVYKTGSGLQF